PTPKTLAPRVGRLEALRSLAGWDEVVKEASKIVAPDPRHAGALYAKAHACVQLNRREEALASLDGFLAVEPRSYDGLEAKRDLLLRSERWADLVLACDAILAIQPHHPRALKDKAGPSSPSARPRTRMPRSSRSRWSRPTASTRFAARRTPCRHPRMRR